MTLFLLMVACKPDADDLVVPPSVATEVPTEDTDVEREIPPVTANRLTVKGHAEECQQALGPIPGFDCLDDTQPVPVTDGGDPLTSAQGSCDKPSLLEGSCNQYTRVGRKAGTWMNGDPRPEVSFVFTCRSSDSGPPTEDGSVFHDVAMIGHNAETGATCFFQSFPEGRIRSFPSPLTEGGTPDYGTVDASLIWDRPATTANVRCHRCHQADPWIHSPWIDQVEDPNDPGQPIVPWTEYLGVETPPAYHIVGSAFYEWEMYSVEPEGNACLACHRVGPGGSCENFVRYSVGAETFLPISTYGSSFPQSTWMPPAFSGTEDDWESTWGEHADQLLYCCNNPFDEECNLALVPEGDVYVDPTAPDPTTLEDTGGGGFQGDTGLSCVPPDTDLGGALGTVATGSTCGEGHEFVRSCGEIGTNSEDVSFVWRAPTAGSFTFDTFGSDFDTTLSFRSTCSQGDEELICDDDSGDGQQSRISATFALGEEVVVVIDSYEGPQCGDYVLHVTEN